MNSWTPISWAFLALFTPLGAALIIALIPALRRRGTPAAAFAICAALISLISALALLGGQLSEPSRAVVESVRWLPEAGNAFARVGLRVDGISVAMLCIVTLVASCVQVFSLGYMSSEPKPAFGRYYGYHSLFIFSMNLLVLAPNLLQLFLGWELVGLTSYLLIGFYYQKPSAARAAMKAFWVTKLADAGFLIALITLYGATGGFSWDAALPVGIATAVSVLLLVGAMGKSAQFPLHVWLPNAMEGPTPVSALLHAATMVAAGVFLIVRAYPLFELAPDTRTVMLWVGSFTALFAAVVAVVQNDIKRVLAYSTCSQLGYMVAALGAGSLMSGYFHLATHAFFKALLFLAAGSVIHAVHTNDVREMGGLFKKMRLTGVVFVIGALSLAGLPGLSAFFSKDLILEAVGGQGAHIPLIFLMIAALLTAFYMGRVTLLTFFGKPGDKTEHAHEATFSMRLPMVVLAIGAVAAGWGASRFALVVGDDYHFHFGLIGALGTGLGLLGLVIAWLMYAGRGLREQVRLPESTFASLKPLGVLARSGAVDRAYQVTFRRGLLVLSAGVGWFDRYVIDGLVNYSGWLTLMASRRLRPIQTGNVRDYVYAVATGALALVAWGLLF